MERRRGYVRTLDLQRFLTTYPRQAATGDQRLVWIMTVLIGDSYAGGSPSSSGRCRGAKPRHRGQTAISIIFDND